jgi:hypothetical protein
MPPFLLTWSPAANYGCQDDQIQYNNKTASNFTGCCSIQFLETHKGITSNCIKIYFHEPLKAPQHLGQSKKEIKKERYAKQKIDSNTQTSLDTG